MKSFTLHYSTWGLFLDIYSLFQANWKAHELQIDQYVYIIELYQRWYYIYSPTVPKQ